MKYYKTELYSSFMGACLALQTFVRDGWNIDENALPDMVGFSYCISLVRDDEPKLTRAEILSKAREAKAAKGTAGDEA